MDDGVTYLRPGGDGVADLDRERVKRDGVWAELRIVWRGDDVLITCGGKAEDNPSWLVAAMIEAARFIAEDAEGDDADGPDGVGAGADGAVVLPISRSRGLEAALVQPGEGGDSDGE